MGYSLRYFSDFGSFLKVAVTRKIEVGITSNFLHSIYGRRCIVLRSASSVDLLGPVTNGFENFIFLPYCKETTPGVSTNT